ncbi:succinylglutamate desuccinylase/aspartoacylase domain-containing protein [Ottowia thiooxydans]|uniref:succinylglutamate desuccinylase/aspartoacylase domain-containing protein n=1 Tax=Ottowia thiooxydans TaxID=219182 RepID=UPI0003F56877|nr:succinylglutamate desuccinylase/aspartoacylase family protein [Ottowia thiooxydans]
MDGGNELIRRAAANPQVLQWHTWASLTPGPSLVILGAVHGNETCGAHAIVRAIDDLQHGRLLLRRGRLTLVPIANPLAFGTNTREGERNLNRRFVPRAEPQDYEDRITRQLAPLLATHDALLDLHSFHTPGDPFAMVGPRNNQGTREPFKRAQEEGELARALGVNQVVEGWLDVYDSAAHARGDTQDDEGIGTNEYMRSQGGYAVTIECGQHEDPAAIRVAERAIRGALALLGMADVPAPSRFAGRAARLKDVFLRESLADELAGDWHSFDVVKAGDLIARRADGSELRAPYDGSVLFPHPEADVGQEWFYLAEPS